MARRRGFLAEMQHQARVAEQRQRANVRAHDAAVKRAEVAQRKAQRAELAHQRASEAEKKRLEKAALAAHVEAQQAEVEELNLNLQDIYDSLDSLLLNTLEVDDYVDLETLRRIAEHPAFDAKGLDRPTPPQASIVEPPEPIFQTPPEPTGLFGRKRKRLEAHAVAQTLYAEEFTVWEQEILTLPARRAAADQKYAEAESARKTKLAAAKLNYQKHCEARELDVDEHNKSLDQLIANLGYGVVEAVEEYISIVLANSVYPDYFPIEHDAEFDPKSAELNLRALIPSPDQIPTIKNYKFVKSTDEITTVTLSQKDAKERYLGVAQNVALRTLHEVFESDRRVLIKSIALEVGTETTDPATGRQTYFPFVAVSVSRDMFLEIDLSEIVPSATLEHLGASVSKNPLGLVAAKVNGVRRA